MTASSAHIAPTSRQRHCSLPIELIERIGDHLFELKPPILDHAGNAPVIHAKPSWVDVKGFMTASMSLHNIGFVRWLRIVTITNVDDWGIVLQHAWFVREIQCLNYTLSDRIHQRALGRLPNLYAARVDAHASVSLNQDNVFIHADVFTVLPPSLRRLEIINAHGPDIKTIAIVKKYCPNIEELRLGRCTMFNRIPACDFWRAFPHGHDAYISAAGIKSYARFLGAELSQLKNLRSLRMGLYLVPSDIVLAHRLYHRHDRAAPESINWQTAIPLTQSPIIPLIAPENIQPATTDPLLSLLHQQDSEPGLSFNCRQCVHMAADIGRATETTANEILQRFIPSLEIVEWMGWFTPGHLGVHRYKVAGNPAI